MQRSPANDTELRDYLLAEICSPSVVPRVGTAVLGQHSHTGRSGSRPTSSPFHLIGQHDERDFVSPMPAYRCCCRQPPETDLARDSFGVHAAVTLSTTPRTCSMALSGPQVRSDSLLSYTMATTPQFYTYFPALPRHTQYRIVSSLIHDIHLGLTE